MLELKKIRKKPVEVQGAELSEDVWNEIFNNNPEGYIKINGYTVYAQLDPTKGKFFLINTLEDISSEALHKAELNDWLIEGLHGEIYACKPDIFKETYEVI